MEVFGWIVFILLGAWFAFHGALAVGLLTIKGGLETIVPALICAVCAAALWVCFAVWLSPFSINLIY